MIIFWRLAAAHLLADFTLQTNLINRLKRRSRWGLVLHCLTHLAMYLLFTWNYLNMFWVNYDSVKIKGWVCLIVITLLHYLQDHWRVFTITRYHTKDGTLHFLWDQFVHFGILFAFSPVLGFTFNGDFFPEKWVVLISAFVLISHAGTILIYFIEKDTYGASFPADHAKYLGMGIRIVLWLFFLIPGLAWLPFVAAWAGYAVYLKKRRLVDFSRMGFYLGMTMTVTVGIISHLICYG